MRVAARPFDGRLAASLLVKGPRPHIDVTAAPYNAVGDGVADDTVAIQAALDVARDTTNGASGRKGATVYLPGGTYKTTATLHVRAPSLGGYQRGITIIGAGPYHTFIQSNVPGGVALAIEGQKFSRGGRFTLANASGSRGTTVGIEFTGGVGTPGTGTMTNGCVWDQLFVDGYANGVHLGSGGYETSEMTFNSLTVQNCDTGVQGNGFNSLDFLFNMLIMGFNGTGIDCGGASNFFINSGSSSGNGVDFYVHNGGVTTINGFRSESWTDRVLRLGTPGNAYGGVTVSGLIAQDSSHTVDGGCIELAGCATPSFLGCHIGGKVFVNNSISLTMSQCAVADTVPFRPLTAGKLHNLTATVLGCWGLDPNFITVVFENLFAATYNSSDVQVGGIRVTQAGALSFNGVAPISKPAITGSRGANAALASLLSQLAALGLITDSSS